MHHFIYLQERALHYALKTKLHYMAFRFHISLILSLLFLAPALQAQDTDYLRHGKAFCLCSFKRECNTCYSCEFGRYHVKIENKQDKKIMNISYKYYSEPQNRIVEKQAKIEGNIIDPKHIGSFYICVPEGDHWIVSKICGRKRCCIQIKRPVGKLHAGGR
jgi:hypothetical protein